MSVINDDGIELRTLTEVVTDNTDLWTELTGEVDVSPSSVAGELIAISSEVEARIDQDIADAVTQNTIQASGDYLEDIAFLKNQERKTQEPSVVYLKIVSTGDVTIPQGTTLVCSDNDEIFTLDYQLDIVFATSDTAYASATSQNIGVTATANSMSFETAITGVTVTNNRISYDGYEDETDENLRNRLSTIGTPYTYNTKVGLYQSLIALTGVQKVNILDNKELTAVESVPAKSFEAVVLGGNRAEIAKIIHTYEGVGNPSYGDISQLVKADDGKIYLTQFSTPTEITATLNVTLTTDDDFDNETGKEQIRAILVDYIDNLDIGEDLFIQKLESLCFEDGVTDVILTINGGSASLYADHKELFVTNPSLVTVTN